MPYTKKNGSKAGKKAKDQRQGSSGEKKDKEHKGATTEERAARQMIEPQEALVERELAAVPGFHDEHGAQPGKRPFPVVGIGASAGGSKRSKNFSRTYPKTAQWLTWSYPIRTRAAQAFFRTSSSAGRTSR